MRPHHAAQVIEAASIWVSLNSVRQGVSGLGARLVALTNKLTDLHRPSARTLRRTKLVPTPLHIRKVRFDVRPWGDEPDAGRELLPRVDNVSLVDLVSGFEHAAGYDIPGTYAGIVLDHFNFGDLAAYLMGQPDTAYWVRKGLVALLGCECREVGCWSLETQVIVGDDMVAWRGFSQPYRRNRDYGSFGPFIFRRSQYERAVRDAAATLMHRT